MVSPAWYLDAVPFQGSSLRRFTLRENFFCALSILSTRASTVAPFLYCSDVTPFRLDQESSDMWTNPSIPFPMPTNIPKSVKFFTFPETIEPGGQDFSSSSQGTG